MYKVTDMDSIDMDCKINTLPDDRTFADHREDLLDEALVESFPASDPVSSYRFD